MFTHWLDKAAGAVVDTVQVPNITGHSTHEAILDYIDYDSDDDVEGEADA